MENQRSALILWSEARQEILKKNYRQANKIFESLYKNLPSLELAIDWAKVMIKLEYYDRAQNLIEHYSPSYPNHQGIKSVHAHLLYKKGNILQALSLYKQLISLNPLQPSYWVSAAYCCCMMSNFALAVEYFENSENIMQSYPNSSWLRNYAIALIKIKQPHRALKYFNQIQEMFLDDCDAEVWFHYGLSYYLLGDFENALQYYQYALWNEPYHIPALYNTALIFHYYGHNLKALECCQKILEKEPKHILATTLVKAYSQEYCDSLDRSFIESLFDQYSYSYDDHMKNTLSSESCAYARSLLGTYLAARSAVRVLDLGCGTGEMGLMLRDAASSLVGVDCSEGMLSQARKKRLYDKLICADLRDWSLYKNNSFDLVCCIEVTNYLGSLTRELILHLWRALPLDGMIILSAEKETQNHHEDFRLTPEVRFVYKREFFEHLALQLQNCQIQIFEHALRIHQAQTVEGYFVLYHKKQ